MTSQKHSQQVHDKAERISIEASRFIDACNVHIRNSQRLSSHVSYQIEEQMVRKEESIANMCESLAILKLENHSVLSPIGRSIVDETCIALEQIDEVKQACIPDGYSVLYALRSQFLGLSFLPA